MPIGRSLDDDQPDDLTDNLVAIRHFTDREESINAFRERLTAAAGDRLPILSFYGVGGSGKTLLVRRLMELLQVEYPELPYAWLNFEERGTHDALSGPTALRARFSQEFGVNFPRFDMVRAVLASRFGGAEEGLFTANPSLHMALDVVEAALGPGATAVRSVTSWLTDALRAKHPGAEAWIRTVGGTEEILNLRGLDDRELFERLIEEFARDLRDRLPERTGRACRGIILLDTYERLWAGTAGPTGPQAQEHDWWVRRLYEYLCDLDCVLLVIAGRDSLRLAWPQLDPKWHDALDDGSIDQYLDAHLIGGLSAQDTQRFLASCGVGHSPEDGPPTPLQRAIYACCSGERQEGGLPFYVGLCANIVLEHRRAQNVDPPPATFDGIPEDEVARKLAKRFLESLSDGDLAGLVRTLSAARWFDPDLVRVRLDQGVDRARNVWRILQGFSFFEPRHDHSARLHATMREALQADVSDECLTEDHEWFRDYWRARHEAGDESAESAEVEAWYHHLHIEPKAAIDDWIAAARAAQDASDGPRARALLVWWNDLDLADENWRDRLGDEAWAEALHSLACWLDNLRPFAFDHSTVLVREIAYYGAALQVYTEDAFPEDWAITQNALGVAYQNLPTGDRARNLSRAIECYESALRVYTEDAFPEDWAMTQNNLGIAYARLPTGDRAVNWSRAIACFRAALRVRTEKAFPAQWAATNNNLGLAYTYLPTGDRQANLTQAIACHEAALRVRTVELFPRHWATTQSNLGIAYARLPTGGRAANLSRAIACFRAALRVRTEKAFPAQWATINNNLGVAYTDLPTGDRQANLTQAIACHEAALRVYTQEDFPLHWATTQYNIGKAYQRLPTTDRAYNLVRAIECYEAALQVRTEEDLPRDWAAVQNNLGVAYANLAIGHRGVNLARAITCYEAALRVRTEKALPTEWAETQNNLGTAYATLPTGNRAANLARAVASFQAALRVRSVEDFPEEWARTQYNMATAYASLPTGDPADNLARAIACYEGVLQVWTEETSAAGWVSTRYSLACAQALSGCIEESIENLRVVIRANPDEYIERAREDEDLASLRDDARFQRLVAEPGSGDN